MKLKTKVSQLCVPTPGMADNPAESRSAPRHLTSQCPLFPKSSPLSNPMASPFITLMSVPPTPAPQSLVTAQLDGSPWGSSHKHHPLAGRAGWYPVSSGSTETAYWASPSRRLRPTTFFSQVTASPYHWDVPCWVEPWPPKKGPVSLWPMTPEASQLEGSPKQTSPQRQALPLEEPDPEKGPCSQLSCAPCPTSLPAAARSNPALHLVPLDGRTEGRVRERTRKKGEMKNYHRNMKAIYGLKMQLGIP